MAVKTTLHECASVNILCSRFITLRCFIADESVGQSDGKLLLTFSIQQLQTFFFIFVTLFTFFNVFYFYFFGGNVFSSMLRITRYCSSATDRDWYTVSDGWTLLHLVQCKGVAPDSGVFRHSERGEAPSPFHLLT